MQIKNNIHPTYLDSVIPITDSHCHLLLMHKQDSTKVDETLSMSNLNLQILDVGIVPNDWTIRQKLCKNAPFILHTAGLHPSYCADYNPNKLLDELEPLVKLSVAVGETGLDWYHMYAPKSNQIELFEIQIFLARKYKKPLVIHARESIDDILNILETKYATGTASNSSYSSFSSMKEKIGIMHCFSGNIEQAKRSLDLGLYISFGANISYNSAQNLREVANFIPNKYLLAETDAPFLLHREIQKLHKNKKRHNRVNSPLYLPYLINTLAEIRNTSIEEIATITRNNFNTLLH